LKVITKFYSLQFQIFQNDSERLYILNSQQLGFLFIRCIEMKISPNDYGYIINTWYDAVSDNNIAVGVMYLIVQTECHFLEVYYKWNFQIPLSNIF